MRNLEITKIPSTYFHLQRFWNDTLVGLIISKHANLFFEINIVAL